MALDTTCDFPFEIKKYVREDFPHLMRMYDLFTPKGKFQGMPPCDDEKCHAWVQRLTQEGQNFLAWRSGSVIGHAVLLPDFNKLDAEFLIFVVQSDRCAGVGSALTRSALAWTEDQGIPVVWLTVETYNFTAIHLYKKFGFVFPEPFDQTQERLMIRTREEDSNQ